MLNYISFLFVLGVNYVATNLVTLTFILVPKFLGSFYFVHELKKKKKPISALTFLF